MSSMASPERLVPNEVMDVHTRKGIPLTPIEALQQAAPHQEPVDSYLDILPKIDRVADALERLPGRERWIVEAIIWRGMSMSQVAAELSISKTWVHVLYHQALDMLRHDLKEP